MVMKIKIRLNWKPIVGKSKFSSLSPVRKDPLAASQFLAIWDRILQTAVLEVSFVVLGTLTCSSDIYSNLVSHKILLFFCFVLFYLTVAFCVVGKFVEVESTTFSKYHKHFTILIIILLVSANIILSIFFGEILLSLNSKPGSIDFQNARSLFETGKGYVIRSLEVKF